MFAVAAASWRSARLTSGRRNSNSEGKPTGTCGGCAGIGATAANSVCNVPGCCPSRTPSRCVVVWMRLSSVGTSARVVASTVAACCTSRSRGQAVGETVLRDGQRFFLRVDVLAGDGQPCLIAAQVNIIARDFAEQRDQNIALAKFGGGQLRLGRFDRAAFAAEHVNFPRRIEARLIDIVFKRRLTEAPETNRARAGFGFDAAAHKSRRRPPSATGRRRRRRIARALRAPATGRCADRDWNSPRV